MFNAKLQLRTATIRGISKILIKERKGTSGQIKIRFGSGGSPLNDRGEKHVKLWGWIVQAWRNCSSLSLGRDYIESIIAYPLIWKDGCKHRRQRRNSKPNNKYDACLLHSPRKLVNHICIWDFPKLGASLFVCLRIGPNNEQHGYTNHINDNQVESEQVW